jgi:23S rRNA pseudouridine1911/1915/1917 synthase
MSHIRYPIVGDPVYGARKRVPGNISEELRMALLAFPRQALHAARLSLVHPETRAERSWSTPPPEDFQSLLAALGN